MQARWHSAAQPHRQHNRTRDWTLHLLPSPATGAGSGQSPQARLVHPYRSTCSSLWSGIWQWVEAHGWLWGCFPTIRIFFS